MKTTRMPRTVNVAVAGIAATVISMPLFADPDASAPIPPNPVFQKLDVNHDGYVSRIEAQKLRNFTKAFDEADENHDGKLDRDEFVKAQSIYDRMRAKAYIDDSIITAKVKAALVKAPEVKALEVSVKTDKGVVILSGFIDDERQAQRAQEIAHSLAGVKSVKSNLVVKG